MQNFNADFLGTIFGRLYQIYIKMKNIPDIYWPGVFQYQGAIGQQMVHTPGSHLLTINQTQIISKTRTHRSQQSILLQLFFATQCYTSGSEIWDLHAKLGLFWDQIWTLVPFGTKLDRSQSLFYFVPQEKGLIWRPPWGWKNMRESTFHWEDGPPWGKMHPN